MKFKFDPSTLLCFTGLASHQIIDSYLRPSFGKGEGLLPFLLGVAPNFLAAALIFPFFGLMYLHYAKPHSGRRQKQWFYASLLSSQAGLMAWEFLQQSGKLVFDPNDIAATVAGGFVAVVIYKFIAPSTWTNSKPLSAK